MSLTELWGGERARSPFVSGAIPASVARWLGRSAPPGDAELGLLDRARPSASPPPPSASLRELDDQFPIDVSTAPDLLDRRDEVLPHSRRDVTRRRRQHASPPRRLPSAVTSRALAADSDLLPRWQLVAPQATIRRRHQVRPHTSDDAVPVRSARSSRATRPRSARARPACETRSSASARFRSRDRRRHRPEHAPGVRRARPAAPLGGDRLTSATRRPVRGAGGARRARRGLRRIEDRRRLADEDRERPPSPRLRPEAGLAEIMLPELRRAARSCPGRSTRSSPRS